MASARTLLAVASVLLCCACGAITSFDGLVSPSIDGGGDGSTAASSGDGSTSGGDGSTSGDGSTPRDSGTPIDSGPPQETGAGGISFIKARSGQVTGGATTSLNVSSPAAAAGDFLLAGIVLDDPTETPSAPGFTQVVSGDLDNMANSYRITLFYKVATSADVGATFTFTTGSGTSLTALVAAYSGVAASPFDSVKALSASPQFINSAASPALAVGLFGKGGGGGGGGKNGMATIRAQLPSAELADIAMSGGTSGSFGPTYSALQGGCVLAVLLPQ